MVSDFEKRINGHTFKGPHKWIICLLGDDVYSVNNFSIKHKDKLPMQTNMSISMMALSLEVKKRHHVKDYRTLC